jgi:hypothetical protein
MDRSPQAGKRRLVGLVRCLAPLALALGVAEACTQLRGSLGDDCLKDQDCLSNVCAQLHCAAAPPLLDVTPSVPTGADATVDADAAGEAGPADAVADDAEEASEPDAPTGVEDAPVDSPVTLPDVGAPDAPADAPVDAPTDAAHLDGGEAG